MRISDNSINFGATKIMSATKIAKKCEKYEKYEVYKLSKEDVPFVKTIASFMNQNEQKLSEFHKQFLAKLNHFVKKQHEYNPSLPLGHDSVYLCIKNDEQITGFMDITTHSKWSNKGHKVNKIVPFDKKDITKDSLLYAIFTDKKLAGDYISDEGAGIKFSNNTYYYARRKIGQSCSGYKFHSAAQKQKHNLSEVLDL